MSAPVQLGNFDWEPASWRRLRAAQQPEWPDLAAVEQAVDELRRMPPLVFAGEARSLKAALARVSEGEGFLLHAGDCAESFAEFTADNIRDKLRVILQMAVVLTYSAGVPVLKVGRIAGQFAKPRSSPTEWVGEVELPAFRGHMVNDLAPTAAARAADPERLVRAYHQAAATLTGDFYDCSAHLLWAGERTRQADGAHVEFLRGVHNPVGVKVGPAATGPEVLALCEALNPVRIPGRLTLIARMGAAHVDEAL